MIRDFYTIKSPPRLGSYTTPQQAGRAEALDRLGMRAYEALKGSEFSKDERQELFHRTWGWGNRTRELHTTKRFAIPLFPWYGTLYNVVTDTTTVGWKWMTIFIHKDNFQQCRLNSGRFGGSISWGWQ